MVLIQFKCFKIISHHQFFWPLKAFFFISYLASVRDKQIDDILLTLCVNKE